MELIIPEALKEEFATIENIFAGNGKTKGVDALLLSWIKYEKQLRRLFSFFMFQHPAVTKESRDEVIFEFAKNRNLNPSSLIKAIKKLGVTTIPILLGEKHQTLCTEILRIKEYRNKLVHGQLTGKSIESPQLKQDLRHIIAWIDALAQAAEMAFGYDGLKRNTYKYAKNTAPIYVQNYPFSNLEELKIWVSKLK
jgi:hypothetical protein